MKKISAEQVKAAKLNVTAWLETRKETLEKLRDLDPGNSLIELAQLSLNATPNKQGSALVFTLSDEQIELLIDRSSSNRKAWDLLSQYASKNPSDERLQPFIARRMRNEKPPSKARGRKPKVFRDYFVCVGVAMLLDAGLNVPSNKITRAQYNAAHVLSDLLSEVSIKPRFILAPDTIVEIWQRRNEVYKQAVAGASVITENNSGG